MKKSSEGKEKNSSRGGTFLARISPRTASGKERRQQQHQDRDEHDEYSTNDLDSVHNTNSSISSSHDGQSCVDVETNKDDKSSNDPVVEMLHGERSHGRERRRRRGMPKGLGQALTNTIAKAGKTSSHNITKGTKRKVVGMTGLPHSDAAIRKHQQRNSGNPPMYNVQQEEAPRNGTVNDQSASTPLPQPQSPPNYDVEAAVMISEENNDLLHANVVGRATTSVSETDPLLTTSSPSNNETTESAEKAPSSSLQSGSALWAKLRAKRDHILFLDTTTTTSSSSEQDCQPGRESLEMRKSRHQREIQNEFRTALEFSLTQCLLAIVVYLGIAILAFSFVFEHWSIIDSCYFAVVSFTTIGYGDIVPTTAPSKIFTAFFALSGVACLGIALGILGNKIVDAQTMAIDQASELSKNQVMSLFDSSSPRDEIEGHQTATQQASPKTPWNQSLFVTVYLPLFLLFFLFSWLLGNDAQWDAVSTFYFCIITACTVGYGDLSPQTQTSRLFAIPVILLAVGAMGNWLGVLAETIIDRKQAAFHKRIQARELTLADLEVMDEDEDGNVTIAEYLSFMLVAMQKVDQELIDELTTQFNRLDVDGTGCLSRQDLIVVAKRKLKSAKRKLELSEYKNQLVARARGSSFEPNNSDAFASIVSSQLSAE